MTVIATPFTQTLPIDSLKAKMKATWMSGNWDYFSRFMESSSAEFLDRLNVPPKTRMLDVACGSGGLCLMAARQGAEVTGVDIATNSIEAARGRARAEGLRIQFDEGDAESLPYSDARFELVTSIFGAMFAPRPDKTAAELLRVCAPGGTIAMGNWTPQGFIGRMFKLVSGYMPPTGMPSPVLWGSEDVVRERLEDGVSKLDMTRVTYRFDYPFSPAGVTEFFRDNFGPLYRAYHSLPEHQWRELRAEFEQLWASSNISGDPGCTAVDAEYLHVVATRA